MVYCRVSKEVQLETTIVIHRLDVHRLLTLRGSAAEGVAGQSAGSAPARSCNH